MTERKVHHAGDLPPSRKYVPGKGVTEQSHKKECDVNFIVAQFEKTGFIPHQNALQGVYGEFEEITFHEAMNIVTRGQELFQELPARIRSHFGNDPHNFLEFAGNPENAEALQELGLVAEAPGEPGEETMPTAPEAPPEPPAEGGSETSAQPIT